MDSREATEKFKEADALFRAHDWEDALRALTDLDVAFPGERRILYPMARCYAELHEYYDAIRICDRLIDEHDYDRARRLKERVLFAKAGKTPPPASISKHDTEQDASKGKRRFQIKPVRLLLACGLVALAAVGLIPIWLAAGIIVGYFVLMFAAGKLLLRLFSTPFKMKAAALHGATATVHSVSPAQPPPHSDSDDEGVRAYYLIEATIAPKPPEENQAFRMWEAGELALADTNKRIKSLDDLDDCYAVSQVWFIENGRAVADEGYKVQGERRLRMLVGVPPNVTECQFVYYTEAFGEVSLGSGTSGTWDPVAQEAVATRILDGIDPLDGLSSDF